MKRIIMVVGMIGMLFAFSACGGTEETATISEESTSQETSETETIEETILVDQGGLRIIAKELVDDPISGRGIKVYVENNSSQNLGVNCNSLVVNGYMMTDWFSSSVAAGKKENEMIYLLSDGMKQAGITTISDVALQFHVYDEDTYETVFDTEEVELKTSAYGTVEQPVLDEGKELLNQDGVRIVGKYIQEDTFWGAGIVLFIENQSGKDIVVQCDHMSINGFMATQLFSSTVNHGRMALDEISILSSDLEENGIENIETIELTFQVLDESTFMPIFETSPVSFQVEA